MTFAFERLQPMRLLVYDADVRGDADTLVLDKQDFLGGWVGGVHSALRMLCTPCCAVPATHADDSSGAPQV